MPREVNHIGLTLQSFTLHKRWDHASHGNQARKRGWGLGEAAILLPSFQMMGGCHTEDLMSGDSENVECNKFLVVPPDGHLFDVPRKQQEIREALESSFPNLRFVVTTEGRRRFAAFLIVPVLGGANQDRQRPKRRPPSLALLQDIGTFLTQFLDDNQPSIH